jgi:hypothetical protein
MLDLVKIRRFDKGFQTGVANLVGMEIEPTEVSEAVAGRNGSGALIPNSIARKGEGECGRRLK